ncbi:hypothetical protein J5N97_004887 [Dioscorea zingiberensis]|uniref:Uncharacterized protein n=1 Tax=Dioscorea zingiberensis TaxID=325984 RepID=A0A9D5D7H7_9LILI|nr:hypothetical protein J5N97_004887 [Dioscorea zingiberensis]
MVLAAWSRKDGFLRRSSPNPLLQRPRSPKFQYQIKFFTALLSDTHPEAWIFVLPKVQKSRNHPLEINFGPQ